MKLLFEQKKAGRDKPNITPVEIDVEGMPGTVGQLIESTVMYLVSVFNLRAASAPADEDFDGSSGDEVTIIDQEHMSALAETGRIAFGMVYNGKMQDPQKAVANALQCYDDGLFKIFLNGILLDGNPIVCRRHKDKRPVDIKPDINYLCKTLNKS